MNILFYEKNKFFWYGCIIFYGATIIFVLMSLLSYNPTDNSWLYISSDSALVTNSGGFLGAQLAALLFYFFGGASFLLLLPLLCGAFILIAQRSLRDEWERLCASLYMVCVSAALLATYFIDVAISPYPGGVIGMMSANALMYYFDPLGRMLFLYSSLCASFILLSRWSFMFLVQYGMQCVHAFYLLMKKYRVVNKIAYGIKVIAYGLCIQLPKNCIRFIQSLLDGGAFNDTGLLHPQENYDYEFDEVQDSIIEEKVEYINYVVMELRALEETLQQVQGERIRGLNSTISTNSDLYRARPEPVEGYLRALKFKLNLTPPTISLHKKVIAAPKTQVHFMREVKNPEVKKQITKIIKKSPDYALPHMDIFVAEKHINEDRNVEKELEERAQVLQDKLKRFGVNGNVVAIKRGPVVTLFEYQPDIDTKLSKIIVLEDDLAMALQAMSIRIIAPIPGRSVVGFEVANTTRHDVLFSQITNQTAYTQFSGSLPLVLGKGTIGEAVVVDLARMPHLLIAGSTGSGKSVALNAILISLLCKLSPDELKLILIDPKRLEFAAFTDIAHLLFPIVTSPAHAAPVLRWVVQEMEERYEKMAQCGARNIGDYNQKIIDGFTLPEKDGEVKESKTLPFIVVVIDELADLMITAGRDIEDLITRITQMARAAGIHMIVATQRPSVDVITGLIKANFPSRISFRVASRIDSRTILDTMGADRLLGRGDMLFIDASTSQLRRVHGAYVSDLEIEQVADHIRAQRKVEYLDIHQITASQGQDAGSIDDVLYDDVREFLGEIDEVSISLLQRRFRIGYNRSARIIDMLESQGLIMPQDGGKTRKVIR